MLVLQIARLQGPHGITRPSQTFFLEAFVFQALPDVKIVASVWTVCSIIIFLAVTLLYQDGYR